MYKDFLVTLDKDTQCYKVLDYMIKNGSITTMEAFSNLKITRLAARISDLEHKGVFFRRESFKADKTKYTRYFLA